MALSDPRSVASRLFRVTAFAARPEGYLASMRHLADDLHQAHPIEFRYNRLGRPQTVSSDGIYEYASLARDIGLLTEEADAIVPFTGTEPPIEDGFELALTERAVQYLQDREFTLDRVSRAVGALLRRRPPFCRHGGKFTSISASVFPR
jgi:hypothetical protein